MTALVLGFVAGVILMAATLIWQGERRATRSHERWRQQCELDLAAFHVEVAKINERGRARERREHHNTNRRSIARARRKENRI